MGKLGRTPYSTTNIFIISQTYDIVQNLTSWDEAWLLELFWSPVLDLLSSRHLFVDPTYELVSLGEILKFWKAT